MTSVTVPDHKKSGRTSWRLVLAGLFSLGIVALMMLLAGFFEPKVKVGSSPGEASVRPVPAEQSIGVVRQVRRPRLESAVGTIRAVYESIVASKILARVEEVRVKAGQDVKQGDILVILDKADLKSRIEQALSSETSAKAKFDQAELEFGRAQRLRSRESITQSEFDLASTTLKSAKADLERARQAAEEARIVESYATVRAPMSGRVIDKKVNAGDTVVPGQTLVAMYDPTHMQMVVTVRESLALRLKLGQLVPARLDSLGYECLAKVSEIVPEAQAESRSFQVKVTGACPPNVISGMFGRIFIPLDDEDVLIVPESAVRRIGQLEQVDVVEGNSISRRSVQLGRRLDDGFEVLSGLKEGEKVVLLKRSTDRPAGGKS